MLPLPTMAGRRPRYFQLSTTSVRLAHSYTTGVSYGQPLVHLQPQAMSNSAFTNYSHPLSSNSSEQYSYSRIHDEEETKECYSYKNCSKDEIKNRSSVHCANSRSLLDHTASTFSYFSAHFLSRIKHS